MIGSAVGTRTKQSSDVAANPAPKTLGEAIRRNAAAAPEGAPVIVSSVYESFVLSRVAVAVDHFAASLRSAGLGCEPARFRHSSEESPQAALAIRCGLLHGSCCPVRSEPDSRRNRGAS